MLLVLCVVLATVQPCLAVLRPRNSTCRVVPAAQLFVVPGGAQAVNNYVPSQVGRIAQWPAFYEVYIAWNSTVRNCTDNLTWHADATNSWVSNLVYQSGGWYTTTASLRRSGPCTQYQTLTAYPAGRLVTVMGEQPVQNFTCKACQSGWVPVFLPGSYPGSFTLLWAPTSALRCCSMHYNNWEKSDFNYATRKYNLLSEVMYLHQNVTDPNALAVILGNVYEISRIELEYCQTAGQGDFQSLCPRVQVLGGMWVSGTGLLAWNDTISNAPGRRTLFEQSCVPDLFGNTPAITSSDDCMWNFLLSEPEWLRARPCFQARNKTMGLVGDDSSATNNSYWQCAALWTPWRVAGKRADYATAVRQLMTNTCFTL